MTVAGPAQQAQLRTQPQYILYLDMGAGFANVLIDPPTYRVTVAVERDLVPYPCGQFGHLRRVGLAFDTHVVIAIGVHALGLGALQIASDPARGELAQAAELKQSRREGDRRLADPPVAQALGMLGVGLHLQLMVGIDIQLPQAEGREVPSPYIRIGLM